LPRAHCSSSQRRFTIALQPPQSDFLGNLEAADRDTLAALGNHRRYAKGEYVFRAGDPGAHVYFLETGRIKIYQPAGSGRAMAGARAA
jgi:CRP-like cAMP-binding protein